MFSLNVWSVSCTAVLCLLDLSLMAGHFNDECKLMSWIHFDQATDGLALFGHSGGLVRSKWLKTDMWGQGTRVTPAFLLKWEWY